MKKSVLGFVLFTMVLSCSKGDDQTEISKPPEIPIAITYDINNDSNDDFSI